MYGGARQEGRKFAHGAAKSAPAFPLALATLSRSAGFPGPFKPFSWMPCPARLRAAVPPGRHLGVAARKSAPCTPGANVLLFEASNPPAADHHRRRAATLRARLVERLASELAEAHHYGEEEAGEAQALFLETG